MFNIITESRGSAQFAHRAQAQKHVDRGWTCVVVVVLAHLLLYKSLKFKFAASVRTTCLSYLPRGTLDARGT